MLLSCRCGGTTHRRFTQAVNEACRVADEYGFFPTEICPLPRVGSCFGSELSTRAIHGLFLFINNNSIPANFSFKKFEHKDTVQYLLFSEKFWGFRRA
jgi:hypothetical protein